MRKQKGEGGINLKPEVLNFNLRNNLRKTGGGGGGNWKPEVLLEEIKGGRGGLELFSRRENEKNLRYFLMVPYQYDKSNILGKLSKKFGQISEFVPNCQRPTNPR